jgi:LysM repeat protein
MRWKILALLSVVANLALLAVLVATRSGRLGGSAEAPGLQGGSNALSGVKTNIVVKRQFFTWHEVESDDYPTYIANLRDIGCPEQTIRDIIIADVNGLYARRRATELVTPEQQWWRAEPDASVMQAAAEKTRELDSERRGLLARLLGPSWEGGDLVNLPRPSRPALQLDGPVLGMLPTEIQQAIQNISARSQERLDAYLERQRQSNKPADRAEMARMREQTRDELANLLTPPQLEEFLLRYSQTANALRSELGQIEFFNSTADEFRSMYRAVSSIDNELELLAGGTDAASAQRRQTLQEQRESAIRLALGARRYEEFRSLHDPLYRDALALAVEAGTPEAARVFYELKLAAISEQERIRADTTMTSEQREIELKRVELEQLKANAMALGQEPAPEAAPATPAAAPAAQKRVYTMKSGDNLAVVSLMYGVPISAIRAANPNVNFNRLRPGEPLVIPPNPLPLPPR